MTQGKQTKPLYSPRIYSSSYLRFQMLFQIWKLSREMFRIQGGTYNGVSTWNKLMTGRLGCIFSLSRSITFSIDGVRWVVRKLCGPEKKYKDHVLCAFWRTPVIDLGRNVWVRDMSKTFDWDFWSRGWVLSSSWKKNRKKVTLKTEYVMLLHSEERTSPFSHTFISMFTTREKKIGLLPKSLLLPGDKRVAIDGPRQIKPR